MITSIHNPKLQAVRSYLSRAKDREADQVFVVEGVRLVEEVASTQWQVDYLLFADDLSPRGLALVELFSQRNVECLDVKRDILNKISDTEQSQGILAVCKKSVIAAPEKPDFILIIDMIRDPGNLGTILRTAASAGVQAVWVSPGVVDPFSPKVLRSGMGAHFRLPIVAMEWAEITRKAREGKIKIYSSDAQGTKSLWQTDFKKATAIIISNEAEGASEAARAIAEETISIPMPGNFESLNAATAAAVLIFEVVRQRSQA